MHLAVNGVVTNDNVGDKCLFVNGNNPVERRPPGLQVIRENGCSRQKGVGTTMLVEERGLKRTAGFSPTSTVKAQRCRYTHVTEVVGAGTRSFLTASIILSFHSGKQAGEKGLGT